MFIHSLRLKNFGCIDSINTKFEKINLVMGDNGSGKSKFLSTIVYSLCDYLDEKISDYIKIGADKFEIDIDFSHLTDNYKLQIEGNKKGSDKLLIVNDNDKFVNSQVIDYIEKNIHNPKLTLASFITMQGKGSDILFEPNQKRIERFKQIFGIDRLNGVGLFIKNKMDEMDVRIKELDMENNMLRNSIFEYKDISDKPDEKILENLKLKKSEMEKQKSDYEKNKMLYDNYVIQLKDYEKSVDDIKTLNKKISNKKIEIENLKKEIVFIQENDIVEKSDKLQKFEIQIKDCKSDIENYKNSVEIKKSMSDLSNQISELKIKRIPRKPENIDELKNKLLSISVDIEIMESERQLVINGKCFTCGQSYEKYDSIDSYNESLKKLQIEKDSIENECKQADQLLKNHESIKNYNSEIETKKTLLQNQLDFYTEKLQMCNIDCLCNFENLNEQLKNLENLYNILKAEIQSDKKITENNKLLDNRIKDIGWEISICENDILNLQKVKYPDKINEPEIFNENLYKETVSNLIVEEKRLNEYESVLSYNKMLKEKEITNNEKTDKNQKELDSLRNKYKLKKQTKKIIEKDFSSWLIDNSSNYIKVKMNEFFQKGYGKYTIDFRHDEKSIDFYYSDDNDNFLNVAMASGYEKEIISLSFRMAICSLQNLGLVLLDEIDSFSKEENSLKLYESILQENFNQFFCITHYPLTQEFLINSGCNVIEL